jgi:hypothetical protein
MHKLSHRSRGVARPPPARRARDRRRGAGRRRRRAGLDGALAARGAHVRRARAAAKRAGDRLLRVRFRSQPERPEHRLRVGLRRQPHDGLHRPVSEAPQRVRDRRRPQGKGHGDDQRGRRHDPLSASFWELVRAHVSNLPLVATSAFADPQNPRTAGAKPKPILVASGKHSFAKAGKATIKLKLTASARKLLRKAKSLKFTGKGTFTRSGQARVTATKTFTLRR